MKSSDLFEAPKPIDGADLHETGFVVLGFRAEGLGPGGGLDKQKPIRFQPRIRIPKQAK